MTTTLVVMGLMNICECIFGTSWRFSLNRRKNISTKSTSWAIIWPTWTAGWRKGRGWNSGLLAEISRVYGTLILLLSQLWYTIDFCCNFDMVSQVCCCNGVATHTGIMVFLNPVSIPSFILFEKTNRGRMVWFYVLYWCCYTLVLSGFIMV